MTGPAAGAAGPGCIIGECGAAAGAALRSCGWLRAAPAAQIAVTYLTGGNSVFSKWQEQVSGSITCDLYPAFSESTKLQGKGVAFIKQHYIANN